MYFQIVSMLVYTKEKQKGILIFEKKQKIPRRNMLLVTLRNIIVSGSKGGES